MTVFSVRLLRCVSLPTLFISIIFITSLDEVSADRFGEKSHSSPIRLHSKKDDTVSPQSKGRQESYLTQKRHSSADLEHDDNQFVDRTDRLIEGPDSSRITGGYPAPYNTTLYTVQVVMYQKNGDSFGCSGSILDSQRILTAAHCFMKYGYRLTVKSAHALIGQNVAHGKRYNVKYVDIFRRFFPPDNQNDVAILTIDGVFQQPYKAVMLPSCEGCQIKPLSFVFAAGYGNTDDNKTSTTILQETGLTVQSYDTCLKRYSELAKKNVTKSFHEARVLCATDPQYPSVGKKSVCFGDSGGPLFIKKATGMEQIGITSFGTKTCTSPGSIEWFVNVTSYVPFIKEHMQDNDYWWFRAFGA